jgi:hemin uptake protein HemP
VTSIHDRKEAPRIAGDSSVASRALLNRDGKLWIEHGGERYLLRRTANDRLILTK